ncbi:hypothetical protein [Dactylosporangium sp. CA-139066]|uniref:hypothetical protein n=1 Tax=Dactylosporangium sp. CA-139066 TaxID=3239930 RepID=UPI003D93AEF3
MRAHSPPSTFHSPGDVVGLCVTADQALLAAVTLQVGQNLDRGGAQTLPRS